MTLTQIKTRSTTRAEPPSLSEELLGATVGVAKRHQWWATGPRTDYMFSAFETGWPYVATEHLAAVAEAWQRLHESLHGAASLIIWTQGTTPTSARRIREFEQLERTDLAEAFSQAWQRITGKEITFALELEEEIELYVQPQPKEVRKVIAKITRRSIPEPNPILD